MKHFPLRLDAQVYCSVRILAARDRRSVNSEIVVLLREALATREREIPPDGPASEPIDEC